MGTALHSLGATAPEGCLRIPVRPGPAGKAKASLSRLTIARLSGATVSSGEPALRAVVCSGEVAR